MDKIFKLPISIEKMAAFLDNNLSDSEMKEISNCISRIPELREQIDLCQEISNEIDDYKVDDPIDFKNFEIPSITGTTDTSFELLDLLGIEHGNSDFYPALDDYIQDGTGCDDDTSQCTPPITDEDGIDTPIDFGNGEIE